MLSFCISMRQGTYSSIPGVCVRNQTSTLALQGPCWHRLCTKSTQIEERRRKERIREGPNSKKDSHVATDSSPSSHKKQHLSIRCFVLALDPRKGERKGKARSRAFLGADLDRLGRREELQHIAIVKLPKKLQL